MTELDYDGPHTLASSGVVVGVDGSPGSELAVQWAADLALRRGRELQLLHGMDVSGATRLGGPYQVMTPAILDTVRMRGRKVLAAAEVLACTGRPELRVSAHMYADTGAKLLVDHAARAYAVVLGATGTVGTLGHLGSTLLTVTAHARGNVVVVRPDPDADNIVRDSGPVVVGIDGGPVSEPAIAAAFTEAAERGAELVAVHVWSDWSSGLFADAAPDTLDELETVEEALLAERLAGWQEKYPEVRVTRRIYVNEPASRLREWSAMAQLVVVGNRGRGGFLGLLLGSTAHALVQHAYCPVMVVHADQ
ncbi:universal stress protein [Nocardia seriolae]|uniref:Universal stress protein n=1 Tax=Nocardia seriolae TaxID=37332 RepID=A0ABC9YWA3_9NOCA|nr:universal stress protein [Nocardia seriolae]APA98393.1 Universal stress protein [Nocardia seriolae]OJF80288.1 universal stress protein [Nocardia seriolae]PSK29602.1 universal stress protein [Nocardia seriolae]QOW35765.1 universal stress protein [Nocardia seriolae]QUN16744.1 universal stress protein [Nocardia seriolae]